MKILIHTGRRHPVFAWLLIGTLAAVLHPTDTPADCGNGVIEPGEECDGEQFGWLDCMNTMGIGCGQLACDSGDMDRTCTIDFRRSCGATCGDGCVRPHVTSDPYSEECDNGPANSDVVPDACRADCRLPRCGDGVADTGEQCDNGPANDDLMPDACRLNCTRARCGDGVRDGSEACDLGPLNGTTGSECSATCSLAGCPSGTLDAGETCDDGNSDNDDGCLFTCVPNVCGDGFVNLEVDPATLLIAEVCDPSRLAPLGSCRYDCGQRVADCGDGDVDPGEECDEGAGNSSLPNARCRTDCQLARCGDGVVDDAAATPEECDRSPGCGADCRRRP